MRLSASGKVVLVAATFIAAGCSGPTNVSRSTDHASSTTSSVAVADVTTRLTWASGNSIVDPPPPSLTPAVSGEAALTAAAVYEDPNTVQGRTPDLRFGLYTSPDGPTYDRRPAWLVWYHDVTFTVHSPPSPNGVSASDTVTGDSLTVVDSTNGSVLNAGVVSPPVT